MTVFEISRYAETVKRIAVVGEELEVSEEGSKEGCVTRASKRDVCIIV